MSAGRVLLAAAISGMLAADVARTQRIGAILRQAGADIQAL
jgi:hypothetical protein